RERAVWVLKDVGNLERRLVLERVAQVARPLADEPACDARYRIFAVIEIKRRPRRAVVVEVVVVPPVVVEIADQVLSRPLGNHVCFLRPPDGSAAGYLREPAVLGPGEGERRPGLQPSGCDPQGERGRGKQGEQQETKAHLAQGVLRPAAAPCQTLAPLV